MKKYFLTATFLLTILAFSPASATAELTLGLTGNVSSSPYKGYGTQWSPIPLFLSYEGDNFYIRGTRAGWKFFESPPLELSVFGEYDGTDFDHSESNDKQLRRLHNRYSSAMGGLAARLHTPWGLLHASAAVDMLNNSNGLKGEIGYLCPIEFGPLELIPAAGLSWHNANYNSYYYGVSRDEARSSTLESYRAAAGLAPYLGLTIDYSLTEQWEIFASAEATWLDRAVRDSPMVDTSHTQSLSAGISYTF